MPAPPAMSNNNRPRVAPSPNNNAAARMQRARGNPAAMRRQQQQQQPMMMGGAMNSPPSILPVLSPGIPGSLPNASPAQLAAMVGPFEASCLAAPSEQMVLQRINQVRATPVTFVQTVSTTVPVPVTLSPINEVVVAPPQQMALNSACPQILEAPVATFVPGCGEACGGCGSCGFGAFAPGASFLPVEMPALVAPQLAPFGYNYTSNFNFPNNYLL